MPWSTQHMNTFKGLQLCENSHQCFLASVSSITLCCLPGSEKSALDCSCSTLFFRESVPKYKRFGSQTLYDVTKGSDTSPGAVSVLEHLVVLVCFQEAGNQIKQNQILQEAKNNRLNIQFIGDLYSVFYWLFCETALILTYHKNNQKKETRDASGSYYESGRGQRHVYMCSKPKSTSLTVCFFTDVLLNYANGSVHESTRQAPLQNQTNKRLLDCPRRPGDPEIPEMNGHLNDCCCDRLAVIE